MQYILSEAEMKRGLQLIESWRIKDLTLDETYNEQTRLNEQGWFTVIYNPDENDVDVYGLIVYEKR